MGDSAHGHLLPLSEVPEGANPPFRQKGSTSPLSLLREGADRSALCRRGSPGPESGPNREDVPDGGSGHTAKARPVRGELAFPPAPAAQGHGHGARAFGPPPD